LKEQQALMLTLLEKAIAPPSAAVTSAHRRSSFSMDKSHKLNANAHAGAAALRASTSPISDSVEKTSAVENVGGADFKQNAVDVELQNV
jgi:hypothetical protein